MKLNKKTLIFEIIIPIAIACTSVAFALIFGDYLWGLLTLLFGFLNAYYMAIGRWYNYIFGILFSVVYSIVCYFNGLFGFAIFTVVAYTPLQIYGLIKWFKKKEDNTVFVRSLPLKWGIFLTVGVIMLSVALGFLLTLIPGQNLAFLDSTSQIINLAGALFVTLRFRESWYIFFANNIIDLAIWIINVINNTQNSQMMLVVSVMYFLMNIYGVVAWIAIEKKQKGKDINNEKSFKHEKTQKIKKIKQEID